MSILSNKHVYFAKSTCLFYNIDILDVYFVKSTCLFSKIDILDVDFVKSTFDKIDITYI